MDKSPKTPLERHFDLLREPFREFVRAQTSAGALLIFALALALLVCNLGAEEWYKQLQGSTIGLIWDGWQASTSLLFFINHALIAIFFFLVGLEIKRELLAGELQAAGKRRMLLASACGGMLVPAVIYTLFNLQLEGGVIHGWGIPMATDTALAIGVLATLSRHLQPGVAAFLVGLAIADDIGAVIIIALIYTQNLNLTALLLAALLVAFCGLANYAGIRHPLFYAVFGILVWVAMDHSGIHASVAGVLVAATVPARPRIPVSGLQQRLRRRISMIRPQGRTDILGDERHHARIETIADEAYAATTPLRRWERKLDLPVALLILPLFAFFNGGVSLDGNRIAQALADPVALGIIFGLVVGKPLGIVSAALLAQRTGVGHLPSRLGVGHLVGLGLLAGIGFTMSTFIAALALTDERLEMAKIAILCASLVAGVLGYLTIRYSVRGNE